MSKMSELHIEICEDLQTDAPTNKEIAKWLEDRAKEMQGINPTHEETDPDSSRKTKTD